MATKAKAKAADKALYGRKPAAIELPAELLDDEVRRDATLAANVRLRGAIASRAYAVPMFGEGLDLSTYARLLREQCEAVHRGDLSRVETMLLTQANTLDMIFNQLAFRAQHADYLSQFQAYLSRAFKAQAQSRATVEALAELKNPCPVAFVKQANIANGPQQVNNGSAPPEPRARAENPPSRENELLGSSDGERMDGGAAGEAGRSDTTLETVGAVNRAAH